MKKLLTVILVLAPTVTAQISEVKHNGPTVAAPRECLVVFREFFAYLQKNEPSIVKDEQAQQRWLSKQLRKAFVDKLATFASKQDDPDFPSNSTFLGAWDQPSTYSIIASRRYGNRAIVDVLYKWGPKTNYPGDERTTSFIFVLEDGKWKLDDIYTFRGEFVTAESLNQYFREK